jgi:integrase
MKIQRRGQAKVITSTERELLFTQGFTCSRDLAFNKVLNYLCCRIAEGSQVRWHDVFQGDAVRDVIILRKQTTKGKQATREVATHPKLAAALTQYRQDAQELLSIKQTIGDWDPLSVRYAYNARQGDRIVCPDCGSDQTRKVGFYYRDRNHKEQVHVCKVCKRRFRENTLLGVHPEIRAAIIRLGVYSSRTYGFLGLDPANPYLFPGSKGKGHIGTAPMQLVLREACQKLGIVGVSSHSWRRTALTEMYRRGVPLKTIQKISGHESLAALQLYLEVDPEQVEAAVFFLPSLFSDPAVSFVA